MGARPGIDPPYDGVYLKDGESERIRAAVASDPEFFAHLPGSFIVHGEWAGAPGVKTAVRPHTFHSPDFPEHFSPTRCVFAFGDGACSLQTFAIKQGRPMDLQAKRLLEAPASDGQGHPGSAAIGA